MKNRGGNDVFIAVVDGLKGFPEAINAVFPETRVQTCIVHRIRHSLAFVGWKQRKIVAADLKLIYRAETAEAAALRLDEFEQKWGDKFPSIGQSWRRNWERIIPFFAYPHAVRKVIYTTNAIESLNMSLRKIIKNRGHFPNDEAATKLLYLALRNVAKKWTIADTNLEGRDEPIRRPVRKPISVFNILKMKMKKAVVYTEDLTLPKTFNRSACTDKKEATRIDVSAPVVRAYPC